MKLAAVAPALFVLVSLCGSPVPAPGGTITGLAFLDVNRNGIHDSCDSPLPRVAVAVTAANGKSAQTTAGDDGAFHIEHVPSGDGLLTLVPGDGFIWPITTTPDVGNPGLAVHVDELQDTVGLEIGSASRTAFAGDQVSISGIIFNDANANGVVDEDECGIPYYAVVQVEIGLSRTSPLRSDGTYELLDVTTSAAVSLTVNPVSSGNGFGAMTEWTPTNAAAPDALSPCGPKVHPVQRYGPYLYEANMGFQRLRNTGTVTGFVFVDTNGDGVRDKTEAAVPDASILLQPVDSGCGGYVEATEPSTDGSGHFDIGNIAPGLYNVVLQYAPPVGDGLLTPAWDPEMTITIRGHNSTALSLPVHHVDGATLRITAFDDANGNGAWDDGEGVIEGMSVCLLPPGGYNVNPGYGYDGDPGFYVPPMKQAYPSGQTSCGQTGPDGAAVTGPVFEGEYVLTAGPLASGAPFKALPQQNLTLVEGEQRDLYVPIDVLRPAEQVIPFGSGAPMLFSTCYSDPAWVQPPFEDGYGLPLPYGGDWPPEDDARKMYSHGIYVHGGSIDWYTWVNIAGLGLWVGASPPGCEAYNPNVTVDLVGYEAVDAVTEGNVEQITLAKRDLGLYALQFDAQKYEGQFWYLFVDENHQPLARCNSFGSQCEWFN